MSAPTKRVRVSLTVEVDVEGWVEAYGVEPSMIREDVRVYVAGLVNDSAAPMQVAS